MTGVNAVLVKKVAARLSEVAIDPSIWVDIMEDISVAAGATGASLLQSDVRTADIPRTASVNDYFNSYFAEGWHLRDVRATRGVPTLLRGEKVIIDQDCLTTEEMKRAGLYAESLIPNGLKWFAGIGFFSGSALWGLSIQRSPKEGPFNESDKKVLSLLSDRMTQAATLSKAVGQRVLLGITNALDMINKPALALDRFGFVLEANSSAMLLFDNEFRLLNRRLIVADRQAAVKLNSLVDQLRLTSDKDILSSKPIIIRRTMQRPILANVLPIDGAARDPFLGARVLIVLTDLSSRSPSSVELLVRLFGLSPAEAKLAVLLANGMSIDQAANMLEKTRQTARSQLKSIFAKTNTHRQVELAVLLSQL